MNILSHTPKVRRFGVFCLVCLWATMAWAQPCLCTDCPEPIPTVADFQVCYDVSGLNNVSLADPAQGVCGVQLSFTHDYIENLNIFLISPAGQQVQLVGPGITGPSGNPSAGAAWNIGFRDCGAAVNPDLGASATFDGGDPVWDLLGRYNGTYYPHGGCLADFDAGPATGTWCIRVQSNAIITSNDRLRDFQIEFCDDSGDGCCYAETPIFANPTVDTVLCSGDAALVLPTGLTTTPNTGYLVRSVVSRDGLIVDYINGTVDLSASPPGTYSVCAIQYFVGDARQLSPPGAPISDLLSALATGTLCGELSTDCHQVVIVPTPGITLIEREICAGDSIVFEGVQRYFAGIYEVVYQSVGACDSVVRLDLSVNALDTVNFTRDLCSGDNLDFDGRLITAAGLYEYNLLNAQGCDSTVLLTVRGFDSYDISLDTAFCAGGSVRLNGTDVSVAGAFRQNFASVAGCDSVLTWNVVSLESQASVSATRLQLSCQTPSLVLTANSPANSPSANFTRTWSGPAGALGADPQITVTAPGRYILTHSAEFAGLICTQADTVFVTQDVAVASVSLPDTFRLNCLVDTVDLGGMTNNAAPYVFEWLLGTTIASSDSLLRVDVPGLYRVVATRLDNGCSDTASTQVISDLTIPTVVIESIDSFTCLTDSVALQASFATTRNGTLQWSFLDGTPLPTSSGEAIVYSAGSYNLTAIDQLSGCELIQTVSVATDTSGFQLSLNLPDTITCTRDEVTLTASANEPADFIWINASGATLSNADAVNVRLPGTYTVEATARVTGCITRQSVTVAADVTAPQVVLNTPDTLRCVPAVLVLDGSSSFGVHALTYEWSTQTGTIVAGTLNPRVRISDGGWYSLRVTDSSSGCTSIDSVEVFENRARPLADAGVDRVINCQQNTATLGGGITSVGNEFEYRWTSTQGGIVGFPRGPTATASTGGTFILTVRNLITGCQRADSVDVAVAQGVPIISVTDTAFIACGSQSIQLDATGSSVGADYQLLWTTATGIIISDPTLPTIQVGRAGRYILTITDLRSTCEAFAEVVVISDCPAQVLATSPDTINCFTGNQIRLRAMATDGPGNLIQWTTSTGRIIADADSISPLVAGIGTYYIEVTQTFSDTRAVDSVVVIIDTVAPTAQIVDGIILSCRDVSSCLALDASASSGPPNVMPSWTTVGGQFCGSSAVLNARINAPGLYQLSLQDPSNGCIDETSVFVTAAPGVPTPDGGPDLILPCSSPSVLLQAITPAIADNKSWWWVNAAGVQLTATDETQLAVTVAGLYGFTVYDSTSMCAATDSVRVIAQLCAPDARPIASGAVSCANPMVTLSTPVQANMRADWTRTAGNWAPRSGWQVGADLPGEYQVVVVDLLNGSRDSAVVTVIDQLVPPVAEIQTIGTVTCIQDSTTLDGRTSTDPLGGVLQFRWLNTMDFVVSISPILRTDLLGSLQLEVMSNLSGCLDTTTATVQVDTLAPLARARVDALLDCENDLVRLDGSGSVGSGSLGYNWTYLADPGVAINAVQQAGVRLPGLYELRVVDQLNGCQALDSVLVNSFRDGDLSALANQDLPCDGAPVILDAGALPQGSQFDWTAESPACLIVAPDGSVSASCVGEYVLIVSHPESNCEYSDTIQLSAIDKDFGLAIQGDTTLTCTDSSRLVLAQADTASLTYSWTGIAAGFGESLRVANEGEVVLIAEDADSCQDTLTLNFMRDTIRPVVAIAVPDTLNCVAREVQLIANSTSTRTLAYAWTGPALTAPPEQAIRVAAPGTYAVTVTDVQNGCEANALTVVAIDTVLPSVTLAATDGVELDCALLTLELEAGVSPANARLQWSGPAGQSLVAGAFRQNIGLEGIYQATAIHPTSKCRVTEAILIYNVGLPITGYELGVSGQIGCSDDAVNLTAQLPTNVEIIWRNEAGVGINPMGISSPGLYSAVLRNTITGCQTVDSVRISSYEPSFSITLDHVGELNCDENEVGLVGEVTGGAVPALTYQWVTPNGDTVLLSGGLTPLVSSGGEWQLITTELATGCLQRASTLVPVAADAITDVVIEVIDATCTGERNGRIEVLAVEGGTAPFSYALDSGIEQQVGQFGLLEPGRYDLQVRDSLGCAYELAISVVAPAVKEIFLPTQLNVLFGDTVCLSPDIVGGGALDSLKWTSATRLSCDTCLTTCLTVNTETTVDLVAYFGGCTARAETSIQLSDSEPAVWPTAFSPNGDAINDVWLPIAINGTIEEVRIFDRWGSIVFSTNSDDGSNIENWDGTQNGKVLKPGVFVVDVVGTTLAGNRYRVFGDVTLVR